MASNESTHCPAGRNQLAKSHISSFLCIMLSLKSHTRDIFQRGETEHIAGQKQQTAAVRQAGVCVCVETPK